MGSCQTLRILRPIHYNMPVLLNGESSGRKRISQGTGYQAGSVAFPRAVVLDGTTGPNAWHEPRTSTDCIWLWSFLLTSVAHFYLFLRDIPARLQLNLLLMSTKSCVLLLYWFFSKTCVRCLAISRQKNLTYHPCSRQLPRNTQYIGRIKDAHLGKIHGRGWAFLACRLVNGACLRGPA
ncbi:hypothetical protein IWZ01DRAFT_127700 [Phyllosticta capitalensis]